MRGLYIGSTSAYSGKNMITLGLGLKFQQDGLNLAYMKPVGAQAKQFGDVWGDEDAHMIQQALGLDADPDLVTPILITQDFIHKAFAPGACVDRYPQIKAAYSKLGEGKDLVLMSGSGSFLHSGKYCCLDGVSVIRSLDAKAVIIDRYINEINYDYLLSIREAIGDAMLGCVLNDIPSFYQEELDRNLIPFLRSRGVEVLGVIPHDNLLGGISVEALSSNLGGRLISAAHRGDRVVESFLIGTMQIENFLTHFRKHPKAAVIVGGDRADLQLVAIEGNCSCLILTGNLYPNDVILARAEAEEIPVLVVRDDTYSIAKRMDNLLKRHKFRSPAKFGQSRQLVAGNLDVRAIKAGLGL
jgi:hypothetical protein